MPSGPRIVLENVSVRLDGTQVLDQVCAELPGNETTAIIGPNGAGKTTLLRAILGQAPASGRIRFVTDGVPCRPRVGYVPQKLDIDRGAPIRVCDFLSVNTQVRPLWVGIGARAAATARAALERVGAAQLYERRMGALSGGEMQRVLLALALTVRPNVLLLDEPTAGVDVAGQGLFCDLLASLRAELSCTMVLVLHELTVVAQHADYIVCLNNRRVMCQGRTLETLTPDNLRAVLGTHLAIYHHHGPHDGHNRGGGDDPAIAPSDRPQ